MRNYAVQGRPFIYPACSAFSMHWNHTLLLFTAALVAGGLNAVAGGGSFLTFPSLIFTGVPPIPANATNTVALWPGAVASIFGFRQQY